MDILKNNQSNSIIMDQFSKAEQRAIRQAYKKAHLTDEEDIYKIIYSYQTLCKLEDNQINWIYDYIVSGLYNTNPETEEIDSIHTVLHGTAEGQELQATENTKDIQELIKNDVIGVNNIFDIVEFYEDIKPQIKQGKQVNILNYGAVNNTTELSIIHDTLQAVNNTPKYMGRTSKVNNSFIKTETIKYHLQGKKQYEIAEILNTSRQTINKIIREYKKNL